MKFISLLLRALTFGLTRGSLEKFSPTLLGSQTTLTTTEKGGRMLKPIKGLSRWRLLTIGLKMKKLSNPVGYLELSNPPKGRKGK